MALLAELRQIIDQWPTYGYRKVTDCSTGKGAKRKPTVNTKRVLRVMQQHGLTLLKHTSLRPARTHDGVVSVLRSKICRCSDHLDILACNSEVVRIVFVIDPCDPKIIAWSVLANAGISSEIFCDLMIEAV